MTKDELVTARIEDRIEQCRSGYYVTATGFLDSHEQALAAAAVRNAAGARTIMYGGYSDAERRMLVCIPADIPMSDEEAEEDLAVIVRVTKPHISRDLGHRDYLGSMLGLGVDRSVTGDILVRPDGADIIVLPEIAGFLERELTQIGRVSVKSKTFPLSELIIPEARTQMIRDTIPSVRLDNVIASAFRISRSKAAEAIRGGIVSVDHAECLKPDARLSEGQTLVLRGKGKAVLREISGESKKGRIWINVEKYI